MTTQITRGGDVGGNGAAAPSGDVLPGHAAPRVPDVGAGTPATPRVSLSEQATQEIDRLERARTGRGEAALQVDTAGLEGSISMYVDGPQVDWTLTGFVRRTWDKSKGGLSAGGRATARWLFGPPRKG